MESHLSNQINNRTLRNEDTLHVVSVCSNPVRYNSRYRLARQFMKEMNETTNVKLYVVESSYGDRHWEITDSSNPNHLQVQTNSEIWNKENLINLGIRYLLPKDWKYCAWLDMDITFRRSDWAIEALHQLQHNPVIQLWTNCIDLSSKSNILQTHSSLGYLQQNGYDVKNVINKGYYGYSTLYPSLYPHSGYAWAIRRDLCESIGGLMDFCILGSSDYHVAHSFIGNVEQTLGYHLTESYRNRCRLFQSRALRLTHGQVGYIDGVIEHHFHGLKSDRRYNERWKILQKCEFDPDRDLTYDSQGLIQLVNKPELEQLIRQYNRERREDSID